MNNYHTRKIHVFLLFAVGFAIAFGLIVFSLRQNLNVFVTPSELAALHPQGQTSFRLGGVVKIGSVKRDQLNTFVVTDNQHDISVNYHGMLPDLFREGSGVIVEGRMQRGVFLANNVLAKHDENYMPTSAYLALRKQSA